eukprot:scaffold403859_cov24-Prasinocladus_malaysianus.AAC.1
MGYGLWAPVARASEYRYGTYGTVRYLSHDSTRTSTVHELTLRRGMNAVPLLVRVLVLVPSEHKRTYQYSYRNQDYSGRKPNDQAVLVLVQAEGLRQTTSTISSIALLVLSEYDTSP